MTFFGTKKIPARAIFWLIAILTGICAYALFISFETLQISTDIPLHCDFAQTASENWRMYPANFVLYSLTNILSLSIPEGDEISATYRAMAILLSISIAAKYLISALVIHTTILSAERKNIALAALFGLISLVVIAIPYRYISGESYYYYASFSPTVWHNSTIIAAMPFSLLLFWWSAKELENPDKKRILSISLVAILLIFIKPSFLFIYCPIFGLLFFIKYQFKKKYIIHYTPIVVSGLLILLQWLTIYHFGTEALGKSSVIFAPLAHWNIWSNPNTLHIAIVASYLAPLIALYAIDKSLDWKSIYATVLVIAALLLYLFIAESGDRFAHGNFYWQIVPATNILYLLAFAKIAKGLINYQKNTKKVKYTLIISTLLMTAHVVYGIFYIFHIYSAQAYI